MPGFIPTIIGTAHNLSPFLILLACILVVGLLVLKTSGKTGLLTPHAKKKKRPLGVDGLIYDATPLMTDWEVNFFREVKAVLSRDLECFTQVRYADFIQVSEDYDRYTRYNANKKIFGKSADFVIYNSRKRAVVLVYELNDSTHNRPDRMERDALISSILASANIPLIQVKPFEERDIRKDLRMR
ncbi:hypothetical protein AA14337_3055 [Acetobacter malorum DSM 14337]|uniref:DUF2726 domain-containing protein n=1 Tax=Acetobacter malorum DSM 14337 TaxID=1307910 RepID=A0ABQ0PZD5_9PROT|nr:DUF2726 domain-containing protein [Acetobacter malorum]GBQ85373.1 hypothetical protein AA14337_3055 [Acetobacter malorum DSM 14337]